MRSDERTENISILKSKQLLAHFALLSVAIIYGANYTIAKLVMDDNYIQPFAFILMRVVAAVLFFSGFHWLFVKESIHKKDIPLFVLCGLFGVAINQLCFFSGLQLTKPINASLIMTMTPILVLLSSAIILKEKITIRKLIGVCIGGLGAGLLIAYGKEVAFNSTQLKGDLLILVNATSYGIYLVLVKTLTQKYHPITIVKWVFSFGLIMVIPFGFPQMSTIDWSSFTSSIWLAFGYVLLCTTIMTYLFNAFALSRLRASTVSTYIYLQPLVATTIALLLQADVLNSIKICSAVFIFIGVFLVSTSSKKQ